MKLVWRLSLVIAVALGVGSAADVDAQVAAGTYSCATLTIDGSGTITAISSNPCLGNRLLLHSGGALLLHSGGEMRCHAC
jgi:hypothetical protein